MNLLFVAPSAYLLGGVQVWLRDLVPGLRRAGATVTVAVPSGTHHNLDRFREAFAELRPVSFRNPTGTEEGRIRALVSLIREHPSDLVVGVNIAALHPAMARLRRQQAGTPRLAMTLHALEADYLEDLRVHRPVIDAAIASNRLTGLLAQRVAGMPASRVLHAPYGVPVPALPPAAATWNGPLRIAWVGRLEQPQKRVHDLPAILRQLEASGVDWTLSIAGDGPERGELEASLRPWLADGRARLLGFLSSHELRETVYASHDVLLITSSWETGPIVAWEAMAAGVAVVTSRFVGSAAEGALIDGRTALVFPVGDAAAAAAQLARLREEGLRRSLVLAGHRIVGERFSEAASLDAWLAAFEAVLTLPSLPPPPAGLPAEPPAPAGRLDRWLGVGGAEHLRALLGLGFRHPTAGSEWPHAGHGAADNAGLLEQAAVLERDG